MTQYVKCEECCEGVPHYYAWLFGPIAMHPGCAVNRIDEEGCGPTWFHLSNNSVVTEPQKITKKNLKRIEKIKKFNISFENTS